MEWWFKHPEQGPGWKPSERVARKKMPHNGVLYTMAEIAGLFDDDFMDCWKLWNRFKKFGLPYAGGWADQPSIVIEVLETIEEAVDGRNRSIKTIN